jgi:hypothetical protein
MPFKGYNKKYYMKKLAGGDPEYMQCQKNFVTL